MGSPLSPVQADIFMEEFEPSSLLTADLRLSLWLRYVDDTFVVWPHGPDTLQDSSTSTSNTPASALPWNKNRTRSFHHPSIKSSVNRTLVQRAYEVCDQDNLKRELKHIQASLQRNGYKPNRIKISKRDQRVSSTQGPSAVSPSVTLPHHLQRILRQAGVKVYHSSGNKLQGSLHTHKDKQDSSSKPGLPHSM
ncbi:uncharacterized protein LOC119739063 [Patiria miniata]|uniref:Helix-turn-helix domain-containing protein n=1 Tax=Patiria miniata TaxID=46514 RepID=A0A914B1F8_PATMI|nr:uncharacterized protein LOC119739063 [Patiria miniata]